MLLFALSRYYYYIFSVSYDKQRGNLLCRAVCSNDPHCVRARVSSSQHMTSCLLMFVYDAIIVIFSLSPNGQEWRKNNLEMAGVDAGSAQLALKRKERRRRRCWCRARFLDK